MSNRRGEYLRSKINDTINQLAEKEYGKDFLHRENQDILSHHKQNNPYSFMELQRNTRQRQERQLEEQNLRSSREQLERALEAHQRRRMQREIQRT